MDIGEVAKRTGLRASALRFYESKGLIRADARVGARRQFAPDVMDRLAMVALGQAAGVSLDEIGRMLEPDGTLRVDRAVLRARAGEFDAQIQRLMAMRDGLLHAADCRAENHLVCPTFRRLLQVVVRRTRALTASTSRATPRRSSPPRRAS